MAFGVLLTMSVGFLMLPTRALLAQTPVIDLDDPDEPGSEQTLNAQIWEYMKKTSYSEAKLYVAGLKRSAGNAKRASSEVTLPTGWRLEPAGTQVDVGRMPYAAVSYAGSLVVLNNGYYDKGSEDPTVSIVDLKGGQTRTLKLPSLFPSVVVGLDGDLYVSGGLSKQLFRFNREFVQVKSYPIAGFVGGIAAIDATHIAVSSLVTAQTPAEFSKGLFNKGYLQILDTTKGTVEQSAEIGYFPYAIAYSRGKIYASLLGEDKLAIFDASTLHSVASLSVGNKPQDITLDPELNRLYVVNSGSDSISVIDTNLNKQVAVFDLQHGKTKYGSAPVSVSVDKANNRLYVALANSNAVAVLNRQSGKRLGAIPVGWYPTKAIVDGDQLIALNAKGIKPRRPNADGRYVLSLLQGSLSVVPLADIPGHLATWTNTVESASPASISGAVHAKTAASEVKHIFYIVRENRTYDQVLGDLPNANGDPKLTLFGRALTPNGHKIASEFVTLDNYYADGEISVLGHSFTTSGYASPFLEWLSNAAYSGRYPGYPFGMVPAATSPTYLWDALDRKGLDYRVYGENYFLYTRAYDILKQTLGVDSDAAHSFYAKMMKLSSQVDRGAEFYKFASPFYGQADTPAAAETLLGNAEFLSGLSQFLCGDDSLARIIATNDELKKKFAAYIARYPMNYRSWDLKTSDLDRVKAWRADFEKQVKSGHVPSLHYLWLPNDHTGGVNKAYPTPDKMVSQNDVALGLILETISHSPIWKSSLILVTEDDAQAGQDHVDATRTVGLAAGPSVRRGQVVSDRFDQLSLLKTIDVLLGLQPLSQNDALAAPMYGIFATDLNLTPYTHVVPAHLADEDSVRLMELQKQ